MDGNNLLVQLGGILLTLVVTLIGIFKGLIPQLLGLLKNALRIKTPCWPSRTRRSMRCAGSAKS